jgi:hypothetical protein
MEKTNEKSDKDEKTDTKTLNTKSKIAIHCAGCTRKLTDQHEIPVYGEWEKKKDIRRMVVDNGYDKSKVQSFDLSNYGFDTDGCVLSFGYDAKQTILDHKIPHYIHHLLKQRYRCTDLPMNRKPSLETLKKFNNGVGLTMKQLELLNTKYPFLTCILRRGHEFVESWPGERSVMMNGDPSILSQLNLQQIPKGILSRLVFNGSFKPNPNTPITPHPQPSASAASTCRPYVDLESTMTEGDGDADQDSDPDFDISFDHADLDSEDDK